MTQRYQPRLTTSSELHRLAEALWEERSPLRKGRNTDPQTLIHELGVQRLELELKNGDLSAAYNEVWRILERYTELFDFAPVAYVTFLANGRISEANFAASTLLGLERSQLIGSSIFDFLEELELARFQTYLQDIGKAPSSCRQMELGLRRKDGVPIHVCLNGVCGDFTPGHGRSVRLALFDRTEQEAARAGLLRRMEAETSYFDRAGTYLMVLDAAGRILRLNQSALDTLGYGLQEELLGKDWFSQCLPERLGPKTRKAFLEALRDPAGEPRLHPVQVLTRDGSPHRMVLRASVLRDAEGRTAGLVCVGREDT